MAFVAKIIYTEEGGSGVGTTTETVQKKDRIEAEEKLKKRFGTRKIKIISIDFQ